MNAPLATVEPHPYVEGAYTVNDPMALSEQLPLFVRKQSAEIAASKRNENRRSEDD